MKYRISYIMRVWITTTLLGAVLFMLGYSIFFPVNSSFSFYDTVQFFYVSVVLGGLSSSPSALLLLLLLHQLSRRDLKRMNVKRWLAFLSIVMSLITFLLVGVTFTAQTLMLVSAYIVPLVASIYFYKLNAR